MTPEEREREKDELFREASGLLLRPQLGDVLILQKHREPRLIPRSAMNRVALANGWQDLAGEMAQFQPEKGAIDVVVLVGASAGYVRVPLSPPVYRTAGGVC